MSIKSKIWGKRAKKTGSDLAVALINPKKAANVAKIIRLASCYGLDQVWFTGDRVAFDVEQKGRLPREERMKGYQNVDVIHYEKIFDQFPKHVTPVAIEVRENSENLFEFEHPENALYVFGPEDGSIDPVSLSFCHRFVQIPVRHCLNLATAVSTVLWDREYKRWLDGKVDGIITPGDFEGRGLTFTDKSNIEVEV